MPLNLTGLATLPFNPTSLGTVVVTTINGMGVTGTDTVDGIVSIHGWWIDVVGKVTAGKVIKVGNAVAVGNVSISKFVVVGNDG